MKERRGNLFNSKVDAVIITTNGFVKKDGTAVMGRGVAREAAQRWPFLPELLGAALIDSGNIVHWLASQSQVLAGYDGTYDLVSFPVKHNWWEKADMDLIRFSAKQLIRLADKRGWESVALPRPGCGNGRLDWVLVKSAIESILDDRFIVVWDGSR